MRKKLLSTLLALSVALTLVPLSALAEGNDGSSDAAGGQQGKVEELTPNLTEVKTETRTDDTSGKSASVIEVSVAPNAKVPFSPKEEAIGRTRDGWWVGVKIVAPKGVILDTSDGTGSSGAVLFRNNGDNEDRAWKEPIVDGGNGSETDPYYMGAWIGPSLEKLAAGETIYNAVWYFNWDGSNDTGITIEKEEFTGATGAADMEGVDQIIKVTFELKDGVQLAGKEESDGLAWPINVTFNTNEGSPVAAQKLGLGCKAEEPSVPTRNGYTFGGWYTEKECKTAWDFNKDTVTRDLTLYAKWTENTQTPTAPTLSFAISDNSEDLFGKKASDLLTGGSVSFGAAGSDGKIPVAVSGTAKEITDYTQFNEADKTEQNGHYLPLKITPRGSGCKVTVTGSKTKTFENWPEAGDTLVMRLDALTGYRFEVKVEKEGKSTTYTVDCSKVMPKPDEKYTVTYDSQGGSSVEKQTVSAGGKAEEPSAPTRNGYTFGGWYTEKECKTAWDFNKDTVTRDLTLYAKWTENTQTPTAPTLSFAIPDNSEDLFGKKASDLLTGGSVSSGAAGSDGKIPVAVSGTAKEITDYTQFNEADKTEQNGHYLPLKITPRGSGCKVTVTGSKTKTFENWPEAGDTLVMRLDALTGYRFEVKVEKEGKSTTYTVDCSKVMPKPDEKYTVTYDSQGGSSVEKQTVSAGGKAEEPSAPTRNGYTFGGWYTEKECKTAWDFNKDTVTRDLTLYAKWTEKTNTGDEPNEDGEYEINIRSGIRHGTVEVSRWYAEPGTRVTITVDPESDYVVDWVEAVRESNGRVLSLTQSGRRYTFTMPASDVTIDAGFRLQHVYTYTYFEPVAPARPAVFTPVFTPASWRSPVALKDVPTTSWNYASAQWAYQNGYLDVAADGTFRLDGPVSHQQMWRIMASWLGESSMSAQELANWAKQNGAANGSPAASSMTRQDVVVYLYQCCFLMGGDVSSSGNLGSYADSRLITASSVRSAWTWAVDKGIISGTADGYLHPGSTVSRGEFAAMLMRLCQSA